MPSNDDIRATSHASISIVERFITYSFRKGSGGISEFENHKRQIDRDRNKTFVSFVIRFVLFVIPFVPLVIRFYGRYLQPSFRISAIRILKSARQVWRWIFPLEVLGRLPVLSSRIS